MKLLHLEYNNNSCNNNSRLILKIVRILNIKEYIRYNNYSNNNNSNHNYNNNSIISHPHYYISNNNNAHQVTAIKSLQNNLTLHSNTKNSNHISINVKTPCSKIRT